MEDQEPNGLNKSAHTPCNTLSIIPLSLGEAVRISGLDKWLKKHHRASLPWNGQLCNSSTHNYVENSQGLSPNNPKGKQLRRYFLNGPTMPMILETCLTKPRTLCDPVVTLFRGDRTFLVSASFFLAGRNPTSHLLDKCFTSLVMWEKNRSSCIYHLFI